MNNTPETDDQLIIYAMNDNGYQVPCVDLEFSRRLERERDEAREQNAKLREIADALAVALERLDALYRSEQDPEAPMPRPDWLRRPLQMLDAELDQIKEGAK
jgi:hypothetical protein